MCGGTERFDVWGKGSMAVRGRMVLLCSCECSSAGALAAPTDFVLPLLSNRTAVAAHCCRLLEAEAASSDEGRRRNSIIEFMVGRRDERESCEHHAVEKQSGNRAHCSCLECGHAI